MATVLLSIFAHGWSAVPGVKAYERALRTLPPDAPELAGRPSSNDPAPPHPYPQSG
jgi:hypothetical protein